MYVLVWDFAVPVIEPFNNSLGHILCYIAKDYTEKQIKGSLLLMAATTFDVISWASYNQSRTVRKSKLNRN